MGKIRKINLKKLVLQVFGVTLFFSVLYFSTNFFPGEDFHSSLHLRKDLDRISFFDAFYYSLTTQTTVGYGDITARSILAKTLTCLQLMSLLYFASEVVS